MATPNKTLWNLDPHTLAKHEILRRYLGAWFPILSKWDRRIIYLDGFCGPGRYSNGEPGSPLIALEVAMSHQERLRNREVVFFFIDERKDRLEHLENEIQQLNPPQNFKIVIRAGEFRDTLSKVLDSIESKGSQLAPTFAFVDPFGFKGIPYNLMTRLLGNPKTEIFINVMADPINRFLTHPDPQIRQHIIELFGTRQVLDIAQNTPDRFTALRQLYQSQLGRYAQFVRFFEMKNKQDRLIYYLFFATNHPLGHARMKEAFWKIDSMSGFRFSGATDPSQLVLFELNPAEPLAAILAEKYSGLTLDAVSIKKYVEDETPYTARQMRDALKLLERQEGISVNEHKSNGDKRKKWTFPSGVIVKFIEK